MILSLEIISSLEFTDLREGQTSLEFLLGGPEPILIDLLDIVRLRGEAVLNSL